MDTNNYIAVNRQSWNERVEPHIGSAFYDMAGFMQGQTSLNAIEMRLLGDVAGKSILHLQCHFGQDSLSLARMGATVTGVDFSDKAIAQAQQLNAELGLDATFVCCDVYDAPNHINQQFDVVFTSYGTIGWLPDMDRWAAVVARFLKPGGRFVFVEFHPVVWMFDDNFETIAYNYFKDEAIVETNDGTYADKDAAIRTQTISWNHGMGEVLTAMLNSGLRLTQVQEYDYSPYNCFAGMEQVEEKKFRIKKMGNKLPLVYAVVAEK